jgi:hypothetical protein
MLPLQKRNYLQKSEFCMICEDDCVPGPAMTQLSDFTLGLAKKLICITAAFPDSTCALLGGTPVYGFGRRNLVSSICGVRHGDYIMQGHCYMWRRSLSFGQISDQVLRFINEGYLNDNAMASTMSRWPRSFFLLDPNFVHQTPEFKSNIQLVTSRGGQKGYVFARDAAPNCNC